MTAGWCDNASWYYDGWFGIPNERARWRLCTKGHVGQCRSWLSWRHPGVAYVSWLHPCLVKPLTPAHVRWQEWAASYVVRFPNLC